MQLLELKLKNFKSHVDTHVQFINGNNVIVGENGAGKSSILEAIMYALYGNVPGRKLEDLIRKDTSKMEIQLTFQHDGKTYRVTRIGQLTKSSAKTEAALHVEGKNSPIAIKQSVVTQEIKRILGHDEKSFQNVVYIRQGEITQIFSHAPQARKTLFDRLLGLEKYEVAYEELRKPIRALEQDIQRLEEEIEFLKKYVAEIPTVQEKLQQDKQRISTLSQQIQEKQQVLSQLRPQVEKLQALKNDLEATTKQLSERKSILAKKEQAATMEHSKLEEELKKQFPLSSESIQAIINEQKKHVREDKELMEYVLNEIKEIETYKAKLEERQKQHEDLAKIIHSMQEENKTLDKELRNSVNENIRTLPLNALKKEVDHQLATLSATQKELQSRLETLKQKNEQRKFLEKLVTDRGEQVNKIKDRLSETEKVLQEYLGVNWQRINLGALLADLKQQLENLQKNLQDTRKEKNKIEANIIAVDKEINKVKQEKSEFEQVSTHARCPTCKQEITEEHRQQLLKEYKQQLKNLEKELLNLQEQAKKTTSAEENLNTKIQSLQNDVKSKEKAEIYLNKHEEDKNELKRLQEEITKYQEELKGLKDVETEITELQKNLRQNEQQRESYRHLSQMLIQLAEKERQLGQRKNELQRLQEEIKTLKEKYDPQKHESLMKKQKEIDNRITLRNKLIERLTSLKADAKQLEELHEEIVKLENKLQSLSKQFSQEEYEKLRSEHESLNKQVHTMTGEKAELERNLPGQEQRLKTLKDKEQLLNKNKISLERKKEVLRIALTLRNFYREVAPDLRARYIQQVSSLATDIFRKINKNPAYQAIHVDEEYNIWVIRFGKREKIELLSGGEQVAAGLAIRFAISQVIGTVGLLVLDEPTIHLDSQRQRDLVDIFDKNRFSNQMITVTHNEEFESLADQVILVERDPLSRSMVTIK